MAVRDQTVALFTACADFSSIEMPAAYKCEPKWGLLNRVGNRSYAVHRDI